MISLFERTASISNQWSLAAFAIAAVMYLVLKRRGKMPAVGWVSIAAIVLLGTVPLLASLYIDKAAIYRVRVTVVDPHETPVEDARVWSSVGGEPKKISGGWQFDIPSASVPANGRLIVYAAVPSAFLTGKGELTLSGDRNQNLPVKLAMDTSAIVSGMVVNDAGEAISGARVSIEGQESVLTQADGNFQLPAHAPEGKQVLLHAEKAGYKPTDQLHPAGSTVTLQLQRK